MARKTSRKPADSTANLGFEAKLWLAADKLRNNMDAADWSGATKTDRQGSPKGERGGANQYKHVVLGLIFLKYISDSFEEHSAKQPNIGKIVDDAMIVLHGQLFHSTQIPVCLWFSGKNEPAGKCRAVSELELALAA